MKKSYLLVTDIDDTLLDNGTPTADLERVWRLIRNSRSGITLVYTTGHSFKSIWPLVQNSVLPRPTAVVAAAGTEVWLPEWCHPDPFYQELIRHKWNRDMVAALAKRVSGLRLQDELFHTPFKLRFELENKSNVFDLRQILDKRHIDVRVIYSLGRYLDVVPRVASKQKALDFLCHCFHVKPGHVITYRDSGNRKKMSSNPKSARGITGPFEGPMIYRAVKSLYHLRECERTGSPPFSSAI